MRPRVLLLAALVGFSAPLVGCAGNTQNVRAYRAYAFESPSLVVALDRTADLAKSLEVMDKLLLDTAYTPGDSWVAKLPLESEEAKLIKDDIRGQAPYADAPYEIPIAKVYRIHLEKVLAEAPGKGKYASLLDAVGDLGGDAKELRAHWQALREKTSAYSAADIAFEKAYAAAFPPGQKRSPVEPPEVTAARQVRSDAKEAANKAQEQLETDVESIAKSKPDGDMLKELTIAVSVAYRLELESLAMIPIVAVQAVRALPKVAKEAQDVQLIKGLGQLMELPDYIGTIKQKMYREGEVLELMTKALARAAKSDVDHTAGFALKESVVDQVMGVTFDSFRFTVKAGAEAFLYNNLKNSTDPNAQQGEGSKSVTKDYSQRYRELHYDVKPILLAAFSGNVAFDYIQLPNAGNLSFGYKTSVGANGTIDNNGSFGKAVGAGSAATQVLDVGLGILGVRTSVKTAQFTAGTVHYTDRNGVDQNFAGAGSTFPFQIKYTQIDLGYDISFLMGESAGKYYIEELTVGGRFFQYALPRILYELEYDGPADADNKVYNWVNESVPQVVTSRYYMGGVTARFGAGPSAMIAPFADLGMYVGAGPSAYYLRKRAPNSSYDVDHPLPSNNTDLQKQNAFAANIALAAGARLHFMHGSRLRLSGEAQYRAELLYAQTKGSSGSSDPNKDRIVDFGGADLFHGPRLSLVGEF